MIIARYLLEGRRRANCTYGATACRTVGYASDIRRCSRAILMNQRIAVRSDQSRRSSIETTSCITSGHEPSSAYAHRKRKRNSTCEHQSSMTSRLFRYPLPIRRTEADCRQAWTSLSDETQRLAYLYERKLAALEALKKSLLHQAFTGNSARGQLPMNEAETRAEHIDPALKAAGWGVVEGSRIRREYPITPGRIEGHGRRGKPLTADYVLDLSQHTSWR